MPTLTLPPDSLELLIDIVRFYLDDHEGDHGLEAVQALIELLIARANSP